MLNRSAIVVKPRQPFLDWLHAADPTSRDITLLEAAADPTIYLIPEWTRKRTFTSSCASLRRDFRRAVGWLAD